MNQKSQSIQEVSEAKPGAERGIAYSYVRFSTARQELGDSLRRQVQMAEEYCEKHDLVLHPVSYRDLGVSAFKRRNLEKGALASFIEGVQVGKIPKGSYLVIEQFDRMSRADTHKALRLLLDLVDAGIKVVTLVDEKVWDSESIKDHANLILAIVYMSRANNESAVKAKRLAEVWGEKKRLASAGQAKRIVTSECPRWLTPTPDKTGFTIIEDRVESIKKVFEARINGYGITSIVTKANKEKWAVPGKAPVRKSGEPIGEFQSRAQQSMTWHTSLVGRLLRNRALLGEYQPHINDPEHEGRRIPIGEPVQGYYPAVLDEVTFLRAQAKADRSGRFPGRRDASLKNWLQGLLRCTCGQSFVRKNKDSSAQPGYARYYCSGRNRGLSRCPGANAGELEMAVLHVVSRVAPSYFEGTTRGEALKMRLDVLEVEKGKALLARDNYLTSLGSAPSPAAVASITQKLVEAEAALSKCEGELSSVRAELADLSGDHETIFENIIRTVDSIDSIDARATLREELSRVIEKVVVHQSEGHIKVHLRGLDTPVVQPLRPEAQLPGIMYNTVKAAPFIGPPTEEEMKLGRIHIDEEWWRQQQEMLAEQRKLDRPS